MTKVLLVDDDRELVELLRFALARARLNPIGVTDARQALPTFQAERPDIVVLDINLGAISGLELLREFRERSNVPIIMLTARTAETDKVSGLELGADDYITKPFSHRELVARIRAQLRRSGEPGVVDSSVRELHAGPLTMNVAEHAVAKRGKPVNLTVTEFRLLHRLMTEAGRVVPTATLLNHVWGYGYEGATDVLRVTIHRLRRKLEDDPADPRLLQTVTGVGVLLKTDQTEESR